MKKVIDNQDVIDGLKRFGTHSGKSESAKSGMKGEASKFLEQGYKATDVAPIEVDDSVNTSSPQFLRDVKRCLAHGCLTDFQLQLYVEQEEKGIHGKDTRYYNDARKASAKVERARIRLYNNCAALELKNAPKEVQDKHAEVSACTKAKSELNACTKRAEQFMTTDEKTAFMKGQRDCLQAILTAERRLAREH